MFQPINPVQNHTLARYSFRGFRFLLGGLPGVEELDGQYLYVPDNLDEDLFRYSDGLTGLLVNAIRHFGYDPYTVNINILPEEVYREINERWLNYGMEANFEAGDEEDEFPGLYEGDDVPVPAAQPMDISIWDLANFYNITPEQYESLDPLTRQNMLITYHNYYIGSALALPFSQTLPAA